MPFHNASMRNNLELAKELITAYGAAMRGSWASIDGRTVKYDLNLIARLLDNPSGESDVLDMYGKLGICSRCSQWAYTICDCKEQNDS